MAGVEINDFSSPDEVRGPDSTTVELVKLAGGEVGRYTFHPGWQWSKCIKPVVGTDSCQVMHVGRNLRQELTVTTLSNDPLTGSSVSLAATREAR